MNSIVRIFNQRFYVKEILILLFTFLLMENIFSWIFIRNSGFYETATKALSILIYGFMLYTYPRLRGTEKVYVALFTLFMVKLVLESMANYNQVFRQLTMFTVLFPIMYVFFIKYILRTFELDLLEFMSKFYLLTYIVFMVLFGRGFSFSLDQVDMADYGPFSGDSRIMHASHVFMLIIPFLWYLNQFIKTRKSKFLYPFLFLTAVIIVHQHRSVWSGTILSLFLYLYMSNRNRTINMGRTASLAVSGVGLMVLVGFFISNLVPGFLDFMADRFSEIFDPAREGSTGNFRIEQRETYTAMFLQRPVFGWTFEGFEMQNPLVDWWPDGTGQHFHEGYVEMLFYHGLAGLLMKYGIVLYIAFKAFSKKLSEESIILVAFCIAGLLFSFSYVPPLIYWGFVGMGLYYLERDVEPAVVAEDDTDELDFEMITDPVNQPLQTK